MTQSKFRFQFARVVESLWFRPAVYAATALAVLLIAPAVAPLIPEGVRDAVGLDGVYDLLDVLASTLLAVAIFSLAILATSMQAAAGASTPRARPLLLQDRTAQNAISTFIGGFIFSIVGIVGLSTEYYSDASRFLLFIVTCVVILAVIIALIRWIGRMSHLGDVTEVINVVATATRDAFRKAATEPYLGGLPSRELPGDGFAVMPHTFGFVQTVNADELGALADALGVDLHLVSRPGAHVDPARPLVIAAGQIEETAQKKVRDAFIIGPRRTFEADGRYGLIVLSEIGSRALSSGVNDPGTAISVIGASVRVLVDWNTHTRKANPELRHERLYVEPVAIEDLLGDAFRWLARDGASLLEVQIRIQKGLATLIAHDPEVFGEAARVLSREAQQRAKEAMALERDFADLCSVAARLDGLSAHPAAVGS
jgi:uncharacterized membrane protein